MSSSKPGDYFSSFLEAADASDSKGTEQASEPEKAAEQELLKYLASQEGPTSVKTMIMSLSFPPSIAVTALKRLADAGLVTMRQVGDDECAELSDFGRRVSA